MKYKIGDKVQYANLTWEVLRLDSQTLSTGVEVIGYWIARCGHSICVLELNLNPYKSAHDKLIEMGFRESFERKRYVKYYPSGVEGVINFDKTEKKYRTYMLDGLNEYSLPIDLELSRVIIQRLEELGYEK